MADAGAMTVVHKLIAEWAAIRTVLDQRFIQGLRRNGLIPPCFLPMVFARYASLKMQMNGRKNVQM